MNGAEGTSNGRSMRPAAPASATSTGWRQLIAEHWSSRAERERLLLGGAATLVVVALVWWIGFAPALRTLRAAPAQLEALESQLQQMKLLAAEVEELRTLPPVAPAQAQAALAAAAQRLGDKAVFRPQGDRATVDINGLAGDALAAWLAEVRLSSRSRVVEAQLDRTPQGTYRGRLVLAVGGRS